MEPFCVFMLKLTQRKLRFHSPSFSGLQSKARVRVILLEVPSSTESPCYRNVLVPLTEASYQDRRRGQVLFSHLLNTGAVAVQSAHRRGAYSLTNWILVISNGSCWFTLSLKQVSQEPRKASFPKGRDTPSATPRENLHIKKGLV